MTNETEKLLIFNRLQYMLKKLQADCHDIVVTATTEHGRLFYEETYRKTDELNGLLAKVRDFGMEATNET